MNRRLSISRREFLKMAGTGLAATGLSSLLGACRGRPETLRMWWWGEQEAAGLEGWVNESIQLYQEESGNLIEPTLQDTAVVVSEFQTASAANNAPDIQFFWNGIYHMESVWLGHVEPLNGLIDAEALANSGATALSVYQGQQYRMGWYALPTLWIYNKEMFSQAGLDPETPPATWDDFLSACDRLKTAGFTPMSAGLKDGFWGEWWMGLMLVQALDSFSQSVDLFVGDLDWRDPKYHSLWDRLGELWQAGFLNDDVMSLDLYPGIELVGTGRAAMTQIMGSIVASQAALLGEEKIGQMLVPVVGDGALAGRPVGDAQGLGISSQSEHKEVAAEFLTFLHQQERLDALYQHVHIPPADLNWDASIVTDRIGREQLERWVQVDHVPWIPDLMPVLFWTDAMFVNSQNVIAEGWTGEQCGENAAEVTQRWLEQNPDMVEKYRTWAADLA
jgi:multiple sugar transport system substrate-binding protein